MIEASGKSGMFCKPNAQDIRAQHQIYRILKNKLPKLPSSLGIILPPAVGSAGQQDEDPYRWRRRAFLAQPAEGKEQRLRSHVDTAVQHVLQSGRFLI
jgi:hypothetical protein